MYLKFSFLFSLCFADGEQYQKIVAIFDHQVNFQSTYQLFIDGQQFDQNVIEENPAIFTNISITPDQTEISVKPGQAVCESRPLDLAILVDSSRSISKKDFEVEKDCIKKLIKEVAPINKGNTQISGK